MQKAVEELNSLVHGANALTANANAKSTRNVKPSPPKSTSLSLKGKIQQLKAKKPAKITTSSKPSRSNNPEEVIPLEESELAEF